MVIIIQSVTLTFLHDIIFIIFTQDIDFLKYRISFIDIVNSLQSRCLSDRISLALLRLDEHGPFADIVPADVYLPIIGRIINIYRMKNSLTALFLYHEAV